MEVGYDEKKREPPPPVYPAACQPYLEYLVQIADLLPCNCPVSKPVKPQDPLPAPRHSISPVLGRHCQVRADSDHVRGDGERTSVVKERQLFSRVHPEQR